MAASCRAGEAARKVSAAGPSTPLSRRNCSTCAAVHRKQPVGTARQERIDFVVPGWYQYHTGVNDGWLMVDGVKLIVQVVDGVKLILQPMVNAQLSVIS